MKRLGFVDAYSALDYFHLFLYSRRSGLPFPYCQADHVRNLELEWIAEAGAAWPSDVDVAMFDHPG